MKHRINIEDSDALADYLRTAGVLDSDEEVNAVALAGGVSNRTMLVRRSAGNLVVKQALEKLRVEAEWRCDPSRILREALGLRWLEQLLPSGCVPGFVLEDADQLLLVMQAVDEPHENWKTILLEGQLQQQQVEQFAQIAAWIHKRSVGRADELRELFGDQSFFRELRLEPYYAHAASTIPEASDFLETLLTETGQRRVSLVHGDYSPKNILVHNRRLLLLDHEVMHWGDPAFDVGFALTHLLSKAHFRPEDRAAFQAAAHKFWARYYRTIGESLEDSEIERFAVEHTLACLLARVAGKSPLEYFRDTHKADQRRAVCELVSQPPTSVNALIDEFISKLPG